MSAYRLTTADLVGIMFVAVMAVAVAVAGLTHRPAVAVATGPDTSAVAIDRDATREEDSPRWDCYVDGNRLCGPFHGPTR